MMFPSQFPFVRVTGTPFERGRAYGAAVPERVARSAQIYGSTLKALKVDDAFRADLIAEFSERIADFDAHYLEEIKGIADGAGLPVGDVVMINARTEIVARARRKVAGEGCTGAIILPERSANGALLHGQNWDWRSECVDTAIVLRVEREDGPHILTFTEAGGLARSGLNSAGIAITANYLECERDFRKSGIPLALLRRKVLEQENFAEAIRAVVKTPKTCANNIMLSTAEGFAINFECAPDESFPLLPENGMIVHANHWQSAVALSKLTDTGVHAMPDSYYRDWRVRRLLNEVGPALTLEDMKAAFHDTFASPYSVCRPPRPNATGDLSATVAMLAMEPNRGTMDVIPMPAVQRSCTQYSLSAEPETIAT
ncbi:hypothetical protein JF540_26790 [Salipiger thiooxidans]|uniref:C45 family autoproteolytic acyltransferase/hydolase n=1 Tax=Salipiger thiooxidans TaxID=282683 RepID=UPI001A8D5D32|nr:C45 family peptidase [Salipiger thiooxidans]MBN8190283.1 hypothetical protein [Salipiger thiooxidans]